MLKDGLVVGSCVLAHVIKDLTFEGKKFRMKSYHVSALSDVDFKATVDGAHAATGGECWREGAHVFEHICGMHDPEGEWTCIRPVHIGESARRRRRLFRLRALPPTSHAPLIRFVFVRVFAGFVSQTDNNTRGTVCFKHGTAPCACGLDPACIMAGTARALVLETPGGLAAVIAAATAERDARPAPAE